MARGTSPLGPSRLLGGRLANWLLAATLAVICQTAASTGGDACGVKGNAASPQSRIVNGVEAERCEWPWQAALHDASTVQFCGGTLISPQWVLTAAHCLTDGEFFFVTLGDHNLLDIEDEEIAFHVDRVILHPDYDDYTYDYDVALVRLARPAPLGDCISTACLPEVDEALPYGETCYTTGWGDTTGDEDWPDVLRETWVVPLEDSECKSRYTPDDITDNMFCAEGYRNGLPTDSCQGDSGGPLVCDRGGGTYTLHGVVSWGTGCAEEHPGVYATVASVLPWITAHLEEDAPASEPVFPPGSMWTVTEGACTLDDNYCVTSPNYPEDYPAKSACVIRINSSLARPIQLEYFHTEYDYDGLLVNFEFYSGGASPAGVVPDGVVAWTADDRVSRRGWRLCQDAPARAFGDDPDASWILAGGDCSMDEHECVTSPNFPNKYTHGYEDEGFCNIIINPSLASPLHVEYFETEADWDFLWVNGFPYAGYSAPSAGLVPSGVIGWSPDDAMASRGWMICPRSPPPCHDCFSDGSVWIVAGPCKAEGECVESSKYGQTPGYGNREGCYMQLSPSYTEPLKVEGFGTEADYDLLVVNNVVYSGKVSPDGVTPSSSIITWTADKDTATGQGWRLCASRPDTTSDSTTPPPSSSDSTTLPSLSDLTTQPFSDLTTLTTAAAGDGTTTAAAGLAGTSAAGLTTTSVGGPAATTTASHASSSSAPGTSVSSTDGGLAATSTAGHATSSPAPGTSVSGTDGSLPKATSTTGAAAAAPTGTGAATSSTDAEAAMPSGGAGPAGDEIEVDSLARPTAFSSLALSLALATMLS